MNSQSFKTIFRQMLGTNELWICRRMKSMTQSSFTTTHIKRLIDSRKTFLSGLESQNLSDTYTQDRIHEEIQSLNQTSSLDPQKRNAIASKVALSLYGEALETCLKQAIELDNESYWWRDVESSWRSTAMYFLQSELHPLESLISFNFWNSVANTT